MKKPRTERPGLFVVLPRSYGLPLFGGGGRLFGIRGARAGGDRHADNGHERDDRLSDQGFQARVEAERDKPVAVGRICHRHNRLLLQLMCAAIIGFAMTGPLQILLPKLAKEVLGLNEAQRGAFLGLMAIALILGGILALPLSKRVHHGKTIFIGLGAGGVVFASLSVWRNPIAASIALIGVGMAGGFVISLVVAGIQHQAPEALRGRVMSMYSIVSQVIPAASGVIAGMVLKSAGVVDAVLLEGLGLITLAIIGALLMPTLRRQAQ